MINKIALMGNGPITNRGCEAIVIGTRDILRENLGECQYLLASIAEDDPYQLPNDVRPYSLRVQRHRWSLSWWEHQLRKPFAFPENKESFLKPFQKELEGSNVALSIGGDGYSIDYGHFVIDRLILMDQLVKRMKIPVVIWGASIGPFSKEPDFEKQVADHFAAIDLIVVREPVSYDYVKKISPQSKVVLAPDPAVVIKPMPYEMNKETEDFLANPCIGLNLSPLIANHSGAQSLEAWRTDAVSFVKSMLKTFQMNLFFIPHVFSTNGDVRMDDGLFLERVYQSLNVSEQKRVRCASRNLTCQNLKWLIGRMNIFIGARMHSTVAAMSSCVPCISIAYSIKAWGMNEFFFGHSKWVLDSGSLNAEKINDKINELLEDHTSVKQQLHKKVPILHSQAIEIGAQIKRLVNTK